jgi:hypothetical protein
MCELTTALTIGATLIGAAGSIYQGNAAAAAGKYNAQVAEMNATLADRQAKDALERGAKEEQKKRMEVAQLKGRQIAASAANGVDLTFGSPLDNIVDTATLGELDALTIRRNAAYEAYDYEVQGVNFRSDAKLARMNAKAAKVGGYLGAAGTVLGGLGKGYGQYRSGQII